MTRLLRNDLLTTRRAAEYTGLPPRTIKHLAETRRLAYTVLAGSKPIRRYRRHDLDRLLVERNEDAIDARIARTRLAEIREHPERVVTGPELERRLRRMEGASHG